MAKIWTVLLALGCAGCVSHIEHGQVDYRVADRATAAPSPCIAGKCAFGTLERRYLPTPLDETPFQATDVFSLELEQVVIGADILEGRIFGNELGHRIFGDTAEIAVLAHVFEFSPAGTANPAGFSYASPSGVASQVAAGGDETAASDPNKTLRLIYYSEDVHPRQPFNFSNITLSPRQVYNGGTIGIHLVVMEIDTGKGPVASLLKELANRGESLASAYSSGASDLLFSLGKSLFAGGQHDDILLDYKFELLFAENPSATEAQFVPGRYVIYRQQDRRGPIAWNTLQIDHNTGRVYSNGDNPSELRDEMYFTIRIDKYDKAVQPEALAQEQWATFRRNVQAQAEKDPTNIDVAAISREFRDLLVQDTADAMAEKVLGLWEAAERSLDAYELLAIDQGDLANLRTAGCPLNPELLGEQRDGHLRDARDAIRDMVKEYQQALGAEVPSETSATAEAIKPFDETREAVTSRVARFFLPWIASEANFADANAFQAAFISEPGSDAALFNAARERSRARAVLRYDVAPTCEKLRQEGIVPRS